MDTQEVLSRHLREVGLDDEEWGFEWWYSNHMNVNTLPASGPLPNIDINTEPGAYIRERLLTVPRFPSSRDYHTDSFSGEKSESESDER